MNSASGLFSMHSFAVSFISRANYTTWITTIYFKLSRCMTIKKDSFYTTPHKGRPNIICHTFDSCGLLGNFLTAPLHLCCCICFQHPEKTIKLLYERTIPAQSQGGVLSYYYCATDIEQDDIIIILKENLRSMLSYKKKEPLL